MLMIERLMLSDRSARTERFEGVPLSAKPRISAESKSEDAGGTRRGAENDHERLTEAM
jgi:hypothetical protein